MKITNANEQAFDIPSRFCYNNYKNSEDIYKALIRVYEFLKQNNLMEKYQRAFLELVTLNINNYRNVKKLHNKMVPNMLQCLKDINFPEEYKNEIIK